MKRNRQRIKSICVLLMAVLAVFTMVRMDFINILAADSYFVKSEGNSGYVEEDFLSVDGKVAYCAEKYVPKYPNTNGISYDDKITTSDTYENYSAGRTGSKDYWRDGINHWETLKKVLYFGYPNNGANVQGAASDDEFRTATQEAIWYFTSSINVSGLAQDIVNKALQEDVPSGVNSFGPQPTT